MNFGYFSYPLPANEPVHTYAPGSAERKALSQTLKELKSVQADVPMYIGGEEVRTGNLQPIIRPHEKDHLLGYFHEGDESHVHRPI